MSSKTVLHIVGILFLFHSLSSQIRDVKYQLQFNEKTNLFDCYMIVNRGQATSFKDRIQFNSQYTLVVPTGSEVKIAGTYMPLQNNRKYEGYQPAKWQIANTTYSPEVDQNHDFISIVPSLSPASYYNDLKEGDAVKLFSLSIYPIQNCGADIKLFENGIDPHSAARGMQGGDFSNGFTVGGVQQKYSGNLPQVSPSIDVIDALSFSSVKHKSTLTSRLKDESVYGPLSYMWTGPDNFTATTPQIRFDQASNLKNGTYTLQVKDSRGCMQEKSIEVKSNHQVVTNIENITSPEASGNTASRIMTTENITLFPNPATNYFTLKVDAETGTKIGVDIMDMQGRIVAKNVINTMMTHPQIESNVDLSRFAAGIYNVNVTLNEKLNTYKLIVVK